MTNIISAAVITIAALFFSATYFMNFNMRLRKNGMLICQERIFWQLGLVAKKWDAFENWNEADYSDVKMFFTRLVTFKKDASIWNTPKTKMCMKKQNWLAINFQHKTFWEGIIVRIFLWHFSSKKIQGCFEYKRCIYSFHHSKTPGVEW